MNSDYNGWKNRQTWNVALWINNDEPLYRAACDYCHKRQQAGKPISYIGFIHCEGLIKVRTPDGISFSGARLDYPALNEMLRDLIA